MKEPRVIPWTEAPNPTESELRDKYQQDGLVPYRWTNGPGDVYVPHSHSYHKVIYVVRGTITFGLPDTGASLRMKTGDRLELPAGVRHEARVGEQGVICLEGHIQ